jgi:hypothetical protein
VDPLYIYIVGSGLLLVYSIEIWWSSITLQAFYLWCHVQQQTAPPFILLWSKLEILFVPPTHRRFYFIGGQRCRSFLKEHSRCTVKQGVTVKQSIIIRYLWLCSCKSRKWCVTRAEGIYYMVASPNRVFKFKIYRMSRTTPIPFLKRVETNLSSRLGLMSVLCRVR